MALKSYEEFLNENLLHNYTYYGQGSLLPIVQQLYNEDKTPAQIATFLVSLGVDNERIAKVMTLFSRSCGSTGSIAESYALNEDEVDDLVNADPEKLAKGEDPKKAKKSDTEDTKDDKKSEETPEDEEATDMSAKLKALKSALKDSENIEKIRKILAKD